MAAVVSRMSDGSAASNDESTGSLSRGIDLRNNRRPAVLGFLGGLIATCTLTVFRLPVSRSLPPTANFWAEYVAGGDLSEYSEEAMLLHLLYGALGGSLFAVLFSKFDELSPVPTELNGVLFGALTSIPFSLFGTNVVLSRILGMEMDDNEVMIFHVGHIVWGLSIGAWVGSRMNQNE
ncbi:hypothetical protein [Halococcus sp. AFM35]|uniref:hypothetical protein n=1 Tax=Halococcus sp. AFM35 TaxID=3421653 RepID=UPI003EB84936